MQKIILLLEIICTMQSINYCFSETQILKTREISETFIICFKFFQF
jgi:hypothetical protein